MNNSMHEATNSIRNVVGNAENVVEDTATSIGNGVKDLGNTFTDGASRITNSDNIDNSNMNNNAGYTTARTATRVSESGTFLGMSPNVWTWFVLAIAAIVIVGLVWYYAMQNQTEYNDNNR